MLAATQHRSGGRYTSEGFIFISNTHLSSARGGLLLRLPLRAVRANATCARIHYVGRKRPGDTD
ncbi:hypothetical protein KCP73_19160 [Salmonella enterica subsp. enterica]|nr:hypothetical protein KCP73_19160 [Salmonella enterica subsp. enterica]